MEKKLPYLVVMLTALIASSHGVAESGPADHRWWPRQAVPRSIVKTSLEFVDPAADHTDSAVQTRIKLGPEHMMLQSVAGLAALAVNEGRGDELVWIEHLESESHHDDYQMWLAGATQRLGVECSAALKPWELVAHFRAKGIIKGYILYSFDRSEGGFPDVRPGMDHSANAATAACPILGGILISEELQSQAQRLGLKMLLDVRGKDERYALDRFKDQLNRALALAQDPRLPHHRAIAIANKAIVLFGVEQPTPSIYQWLDAPAYVMGWNAPGEGEFLQQMSRYGHILLPSNWAINLPVLSAGSEDWPVSTFKGFDPRSIDWDRKHAVSFIMSEGDNVQWTLGDFCTHPFYWGSPDHGSFPIGWSNPYPCLAQVCPEAYAYLRKTQPDECNLSNGGGGYYFPDLLGAELDPAERRRLLTEHARRLNYFMSKAGMSTIIILCEQLDSPGAHEAYRIYAQEIDNLLGMFAIQYFPYEAGAGDVYWTVDRDGREIPIVTCRYCIWANLDQPRCGTPAKIARLINDDATARNDTNPLLSWSIIHAWSGFKKIDDDNETAENAQFMAPGANTGVTPTKWCIDRLDPQINVVTPEELLWRIRMQRDPQQTKALLQELSDIPTQRKAEK